MGFIRERKVYAYTSRAQARSLGHKIVGEKWIDTNKGDDLLENYRSRLVAQEFSSKHESGLFAATPPLASLKALIGVFVSDVYDQHGKWRDQEGDQRVGIMLIDITRAHFYAAAQRQLIVELPPEDPRPGDLDAYGELLQSLLGTRDESSNWEKEFGSGIHAKGEGGRRYF